MPASIDPLQVPTEPSSHHQQFQSRHDAMDWLVQLSKCQRRFDEFAMISSRRFWIIVTDLIVEGATYQGGV